jgi:basic membrane protein A
MQAAADAGLLSIGCDSNQDYLHPGSVLTSALKRVDVAVDTVFREARDGTWKPGGHVLGLAEDGVGYSLDDSNRTLLTPEIQRRLEAARADIISGKIAVPDYKAP